MVLVLLLVLLCFCFWKAESCFRFSAVVEVVEEEEEE